ncbi:MAG: tetratricopeptide repeat protein [Chlorobiaceae bacterium]|jgi:predicted negative regulator of RcsB-dependent stress response|nr:tetratricopeptide repeat protein [Chlorobiaceae bacterium]
MNEIQTGAPAQNNEKLELADHLLYILIKYRNALIGALVLLVCIGGGVFFWIQNQQNRENEAALQLSKVAPFYDHKEFGIAINGQGKMAGLKKIADDYAGTSSGNMASLMLANAYYLNGNIDTALNVFKTVSIDNKDLAAAALAGSGACYFEKKQYAEAGKAYDEASKKAETTALKSLYLAKEANCFRQANQLAKAAELDRKIIADYPLSQGAAIAQQTLWQISGNL